MGIENNIKEGSQLEFDFMKKASDDPTKFQKIIIAGGLTAALLGVAGIALSEIPEYPPHVNVSKDVISVEPYHYEGDYLTIFADGRKTLMLVDGELFGHGAPYRWYKTDNSGLVQSIYGDVDPYERKSDFAKNPEIFKEADNRLKEVLKKYEPHIQSTTLF